MHKLHLLADISSSVHTLHNFRTRIASKELQELLPPRRSWYRPRAIERENFTNGQKLHEYSLYKTVLKIHNSVTFDGLAAPIWYDNLNTFIKKIQSRINDPESTIISTPTIKPIKKIKTKLCKECRPISIYELEDRVLISLTAKYFTQKFDHLFCESSFAFRAVQSDGCVKTHHDTIYYIQKYLTDNAGSEIFAAECDIRKFSIVLIIRSC